jgi:hypothetical protein
MVRRGNPPDVRDWRSLPWRVRIGGIVELAGVGSICILLAQGVLTPATAAIGFSAGLIAFVLVFDSRRSWWPAEVDVPYDYDPLAANGHRWIVVGLAVIIGTLILVAAGLVR